MRESIGGGWLFGIVIIFIFLFSGFLAYSVSYTRAFNVKNEVINYIEQNMGFTKYTGVKDIKNEVDASVLNESVEGKIHYLVTKAGYDFETNANVGSCPTNNNFDGVCIIKYCKYNNDGTLDKVSDPYYKVTTYITFNIRVLGLNFTIPISGETSPIYTDNSNFRCNDNY